MQGNHEAYHTTWPTTHAVLRQMEPALPGLVVLDRGIFRMTGSDGRATAVLGCGLLSHVPFGPAVTAADTTTQPCLQSPAVRAGVVGHTHYNCDYVIERSAPAGPLRLGTNQRGYYFEQPTGYVEGKIV